MRTVSFSNQEIQNVLNDNFVNTFINTKGDPTSGMSIDHAPNDRSGTCVRGNGKQNVQTLFLTPEGGIFHAATGFLSSEDLATEISFAANLFKQLEQSNNDVQIVEDSHRQRLFDAGFSKDQTNDHSSRGLLRTTSSQYSTLF